MNERIAWQVRWKEDYHAYPSWKSFEVSSRLGKDVGVELSTSGDRDRVCMDTSVGSPEQYGTSKSQRVGGPSACVVR